jgi:hypothetical protein
VTERGKRLLLAVLALQDAHKGTARPNPHVERGPARTAAGRRVAAWVEQGNYGPKVARLYADRSGDAERKRVSRGLAALEDAGLVTTWGPGCYVVRVRLTELGEKTARALAGAATRT